MLNDDDLEARLKTYLELSARQLEGHPHACRSSHTRQAILLLPLVPFLVHSLVHSRVQFPVQFLVHFLVRFLVRVMFLVQVLGWRLKANKKREVSQLRTVFTATVVHSHNI